jgi:C4-dicarboxylate transporter, DctM subunit
VDLSNLAVILAFAVLLLLMGLGIPVGWTMLLSGLVGFLTLGNLDRGLYLASYTAWSVSTMESLICIPLYLVMGQMLFVSGMTGKLFELAMDVLGRFKIKGGLNMAVVVACGIFGAVSGSVSAAISTFGPVVMPEAVKYKYSKNFVATNLAFSGSLASMIPPSLNLIMYGFLTETSIADLFMAGLFPGIGLVLVNCVVIYMMIMRNPSLAQTDPSSGSWKQTGGLLVSNFPVLVVIAIILGGIYLGWFTPTESAGVGAALVLIFAFGARKLGFSGLVDSFSVAGRTYGMILVLLIGAYALTGFITVSQIVTVITQSIVNLGLSKYAFLAAVWVLYFVLGCGLGSFVMIVFTLPILFPMVVALGIDPIWFGIFCNLAVEIAVVTPPVALNVYTMQGVANDPEVTSAAMFRMVWPFIIASCLFLILLVLFPGICLWLPSTMH